MNATTADVGAPGREPAVAAVEYAGWLRRAAAWALDGVVLWFALSVLAAVPLAQPVGLAIFPAYFTVSHGRRSGRTLGKAAVGIAVRDERTFGPIGYGRAFLRWLVTALFWLPFVVASFVALFLFFAAAFSGDDTGVAAILVFWPLSAVPGILDGLSPLWNARNRAWHDRAAGTIVVRV